MKYKLDCDVVNITENDLKGEWYPIEIGTYAGYYTKHLHTKNVIIFAIALDDGHWRPEFALYSEDQNLH